MHNLFGNQNVDKLVAVSILVILLVLAYLLFSEFYLAGLSEVRSEIGVLRQKSEKIESIIVNESKYLEEIKEVKSKYRQSMNFLTSRQASTASSEIQNKIKDIINKNTKAKILSLKPYPVIDHDGYSEVSVEIRIKDIGHEEILNMLYKIESETPLIFIKELDIGRSQQQYKSLLRTKKSGDSNLSVSFVASAFFRNSDV